MRLRIPSQIANHRLPYRLLVLGLTFFAIGFDGWRSFREAHCQEPKPTSDERDFSTELPRIAPLSPSEAHKSFDVAPGFKIELVAAEPLVIDPIAFSFNGRGELFVVEMIDYSEQENDSLGRVVRLTDTDGDGKMDQRSVLVDQLSWPTSIHTWKDGVIVIAPPTMTWYRDTDHDGKHDKVEILCEGFGRTNVQGMANSLRWTVDGYIVGSTSSSGALLNGKAIVQPPLELRGRDFRIEPVIMKLEAVSGGGQHGAAINRWGDRFVTSNSDHLQQIIDLDSWLSGHFVGSLPIAARRSIAIDGPQAEVFRTSPIEPWRIVRTRLRVSGEVPGAIEGGGRAAGYFTGATGTWIMDAEAEFGIPGFDTALACDVGSNLVHRKKLESQDLFWTASRIDEKSELVQSSDIWFRPVQLGDGPDGALYIADMYREVIEHPKSLPPVIKKHLDLTSGNDRGRIWRVSRVNKQADVTSIQANSDPNRLIANLDNEGLVTRLSSSIAWQRFMASQLIIERQAIDSTRSLRKLVITQNKPETQLLALHLLARLGQLEDTDLIASMNNLDPRVNRHAIALACQQNRAEVLLSNQESISQMISRNDARLRLELAMAASFLPLEPSILLLCSLLPFAADNTTRSVIIAAAGEESWRLLDPPSDKRKALDAATERIWLASLLPYWCQQLNAGDSKANKTLSKNLQQLIHRDLETSPNRAYVWADAIAKLPSRLIAERFFACWQPNDLETWRQTIRTAIDQLSIDSSERERHAGWLRFGIAAQRVTWLDIALSPNAFDSNSMATIEACLWADVTATTSVLLERFSSMTPRLQEPVLLALTGNPECVNQLADAIDGKRLAIPQITPMVRQRMVNHPNLAIRKRFAKQLEATEPTDTQLKSLVEQYRIALQASPEKALDAPSLERGKMSFQKNCATCHRIGQVGQDVGPPLKSLHEKSPEQLLISILDPNREVDPRFQAYSVLIDDGRVITGVIREESANQIVLAESGGKFATIARNEIEQVKGNGYSLMPQGLQQQINPEAMIELIAWLRSVKPE